MDCLIVIITFGHSILLCYLFPQPCTMSSQNSSDAESDVRPETIAMLEFGEGGTRKTAFGSKKAALTWFNNWMATLDGILQRTIQLKTLYILKNGWSLKVRLLKLEGSSLDLVIEAFSQITGSGGSVRILSDEDAAQDTVFNEMFKRNKTRKAEECGDFGLTSTVVNRLSQYFGNVKESGPTKRQKRSAMASSELLNRSHKIGSAGLKEAVGQDDEEEE